MLEGHFVQNIDSYQHVDNGSKCMCCDICAELCDCGNCENKKRLFIYL